MKIIVCVKQVPGTTKVAIDEETGVLKRDGVDSKMNPYDLYALETALRLKEKIEATVIAITMGPPQAEAVIREAYLIGVDEGYLFSDRKFAGSDVLATSYTISQGIRAIGAFDLIICGRQTTDGDTAQVGPAVAEYLGIPHVTWVKAIPEADRQRIVVEQDLVDSYELVELPYPCLISVEKGIYQPRLPSFKRKLETVAQSVKVFRFSDFADQDERKYGLNGSSTQVERIFPPAVNTNQILWEGEANATAAKIYQVLKDAKFV